MATCEAKFGAAPRLCALLSAGTGTPTAMLTLRASLCRARTEGRKPCISPNPLSCVGPASVHCSGAKVQRASVVTTQNTKEQRSEFNSCTMECGETTKKQQGGAHLLRERKAGVVRRALELQRRDGESKGTFTVSATGRNDVQGSSPTHVQKNKERWQTTGEHEKSNRS